MVHNGGTVFVYREHVVRRAGIVTHSQGTRWHTGNGQPGDVRAFTKQPCYGLERNVAFDEVSLQGRSVAPLHVRRYGKALLNRVKIVYIFGNNHAAVTSLEYVA